MTIASALDKLNDKLAGSDQPAAQTIESMILRIIDNIDAGGGGSIPVASADTLGGIKVGENLSITEGGVLSATGGGGVLVVHMTELSSSKSANTKGGGGTPTHALDKTYAEIVTAAQSGCVVLYHIIDGANIAHYLDMYGLEYEAYVVSFNDLSNTSTITFYAETENDYPSGIVE